ncbi:MAG: HesA/MoeB/ThiF family protein [Chloroflexota bacterium]|nr:HesA/MoeB/ThiF family protein [Chloroflexota bacterium]
MLSGEERERYARQIGIPGFNVEGQEKLKQARVLVAGVGALGTVVAAYLAAAGVGHIRIVDGDAVELSNLNRQILHWTRDIGRKKTESAGEKLGQANPCVQVETVAERIAEDNVARLSNGCDAIVDAVDDYDTRYLLNRVALERGVPFIHGGVHGWEGMVTTILPEETACLRCVFPEPPPTATVPVLGAVAGVVGCVQATEVVKYITGLGELLANRLVVFDGIDLRFREVRLRRDPRCVDCSSARGGQRASDIA